MNPATANNGATALIYASTNVHLDIVECLLQDERVDPATADNSGDTALIFACFVGHLDVVKLFLAHPRTDPTAIMTGGNRIGYSAIKYAVEENHLPVIELLLSDLRVLRALRKDGVPPAAIKLELARRAWASCARALRIRSPLGIVEP